MNSIRTDFEMSPFPDRSGAKQALKPVPIDRRPLDNEYAWKGNPYAVDGWLKPARHLDTVRLISDETVAPLAGARVLRLSASHERTFVAYAETDRGIFVTRDGGMSWRASTEKPALPIRRKIYRRRYRAGAFRWRHGK